MNLYSNSKPPLDELLHYGVKGMKWGVRKKYTDYRNSYHTGSPGAVKTSVTTKTGERISIEKNKPGPLYLAVAKLTKTKPTDSLTTMSIRDSSGKKVGSFQIWKENESTIRGEWLQIKKSAQGRGYSKAAIEGLLKAAKRNSKFKSVRLQVPSEAEAAKHIYSAIGFRKDKDLGETSIYGNIEDWVYDLKK